MAIGHDQTKGSPQHMNESPLANPKYPLALAEARDIIPSVPRETCIVKIAI